MNMNTLNSWLSVAWIALAPSSAFAHAGHGGAHSEQPGAGGPLTEKIKHGAARFKAAHAKMQNEVFFVQPNNGETVKSPVKVVMGVKGYKIGPLGDLTVGLGHHHLLINQAPIQKGTVIPMDDNHIHFGKGQTETEVQLKPGKYSLTLQFADGAHRSYGPDLSSTIEVTVVSETQ